MELIIIVAMARNRVIGRNNTIPWHIPEEIRYFKETTMGHAVIMGRKTYESIGFPLPGRLNVVLSKNSKLHLPGCHIADSLEKGLNHCIGQEKVFIIGGKTLYEASMERVDTILLSILDKEYEGDTFFPHIPAEQFQHVSEKRMGEKQPFTLHRYQRIKTGA